MSNNRFSLIGGTNGIPQTQVLLDQLGRTITKGDMLVVKQNEFTTFCVLGVHPATDPRAPAGTQVLEIATRIQMLFPPSATGRTVLSAVIAERIPEEAANAERGAMYGRVIEADGIPVVSGQIEGKESE